MAFKTSNLLFFILLIFSFATYNILSLQLKQVKPTSTSKTTVTITSEPSSSTKTTTTEETTTTTTKTSSSGQTSTTTSSSTSSSSSSSGKTDSSTSSTSTTSTDDIYSISIVDLEKAASSAKKAYQDAVAGGKTSTEDLAKLKKTWDEAESSLSKFKIKICAAVEEFRKAKFDIEEEVKNLIKQFKKHVEMYKDWEAAAKTEKEKQHYISQEKHIIGTYIEKLAVMQTTFSGFARLADNFNDAHCKTTSTTTDTTDSQTSGSQSQTDTTGLIQFVQMLKARMAELNMTTENKAFIEMSTQLLKNKKH